jgi:hypothetical protein
MGSLIRLFAIACSGLILLGFAYFATDEMSRGSQNQQNALDSELAGTEEPPPVAPSPSEEAERERLNGPFREAVEDTNDVLLGPFTGIVESADTRWVGHGVPALLGLLLYGLLLGMLANMLPKARAHDGEWRAAEGS